MFLVFNGSVLQRYIAMSRAHSVSRKQHQRGALGLEFASASWTVFGAIHSVGVVDTKEVLSIAIYFRARIQGDARNEIARFVLRALMFERGERSPFYHVARTSIE